MKTLTFFSIYGAIFLIIFMAPLNNTDITVDTPSDRLDIQLFLDTNSIDAQEFYEGYHDCREFSTELKFALQERGYKCGYAVLRPTPDLRKTIGDSNESRFSLHRIVWVEINNEILFIEPQSDRIFTYEELSSNFKKRYVDVVIDGYYPYYFTVPFNSTLNVSNYTEPENDTLNIVTRKT
jgi:hypothetical protein